MRGTAIDTEDTDLGEAVERALAATARLRDALAALAQAPTAPIARLVDLADERDAAYRELGRAICEALLAGDEIHIGDAEGGEAAPVVDAGESAGAEGTTPEIAEEVEAAVAPPPPAPAVGSPEPVALGDDVPQPPRPTTPPTPEALAQLQGALANPSWRDDTPRADRLEMLASRWGRPGDDLGGSGAVERVVTASRALADWDDLPADWQRRLLAYAAATARAIQDHGGAAAQERLGPVFSRLTAWSAEKRPGSVHGLARVHRPRHGTWGRDAERAWEDLGLAVPVAEEARAPFTVGDLQQALDDGVDDATLHEVILALERDPSVDRDHVVQVLAPHIERLSGDRRLKKIKKRVARFLKGRREGGAAEMDALDATWPWYRHTHAKRAVLVGGDERDRNRERLKRYFGFATLHWETGWDVRRNEALAERIARGSVDLVILIRRFLQHKTSDQVVPVCKDNGVPFVAVSGGYGVTAIRAAIESHLDPDGAPTGER